VAQLLKQKNLNFEWTLCGDGPLYEEFLTKVKNRSLEDVITCVGFQKNLKPFYFQTDLYVQPSLTESFGLSVIDGIKAQKPVLLSNVEAFHKIIDKKLYKDNFIDLGPHFIKELSDRILKFNNDQLFRNTIFNATIAACREIQKFSYDDWVKAWQLFIDRKKILFISPITTEATGGLQKQLYLQSTKLKSMNYDIYLLQRQDKVNGKEIFSSQKWSHVRFIQTPHLSFISNWKWGQKMNSLLFLTFGILKVSRFRHFDIAHAHQMYSPAIIGVVAKKLFKCRLVVKVTASGVLGEVAQLHNMDFLKLRKLCFTYVDKFLTLTSSMRDELIEFGINRNQVEVVPNSVEIFDAVEYKDHAKISILYSGRISTEKSIETLIRASQKLAVKLDQYQIDLNIAGRVYSDRNNYIELLELSEQNPKNMTINFLGHVSDMSYLYKAADVFVLPSLSEGMSNSLLEAMSYGLPCVVSSISANTALISDQQNGLVFETAKEEQLYIKLMHLFGDKGEGLQRRQKLGQEARKFIQENFSVENVCKKIETQYDLQ
jgi:glycosyltransferase involved in cell wall biosynthesis